MGSFGCYSYHTSQMTVEPPAWLQVGKASRSLMSSTVYTMLFSQLFSGFWDLNIFAVELMAPVNATLVSTQGGEASFYT